ncbi:MAG: WbqC family protein [Bacteroidota bacterium]
MKIALLHPQFAPNLYDLASMIHADRIIWQDTEPWSRKGRSHRAKIRTADGFQWVNIPIKTEDKGKSNGEVRIDHNQDWITPFWYALEYNYRNSIYFDVYEPELRADLKHAREIDRLISFNIYFIKRLFRYLELNLTIEYASSIKEYDTDPDHLLHTLHASTLFMEHQARNYQRQATHVDKAMIQHPRYRQHFPGFIEECSILDVLFEYGPESFELLDGLYT